LIPCWFIGNRDASCAYHFMHDLAERLDNRVQLTTDGHRAYLSAVEDAFGANIDYAMLQKIYGNVSESPETRYSPAICMGARKAVIKRQAGLRAHFYELRRAPEPHDENVHAPLHSIDEWLLQESREPRTRARSLFHVLQFLPDSSGPARHSCDGSWRF
jgi:hypothetical protein